MGAFRQVFDSMLSAKTAPSRRASTASTAPVSPVAPTSAFPSIDQAHIGYKLLLFCKYLADQKLFPRGDFFPSSIVQVSSLLELLLTRSYQPACSVSEAAVKCVASEFPVSMSLAKVDSSGIVYCICVLLKLLIELQKDSPAQTNKSSIGELFSSLFQFTALADQTLNSADHLRRFMFSNALDPILNAHSALSVELLNATIGHCAADIKSRRDSEEMVYGLVSRQSKFPAVQNDLRAILVRCDNDNIILFLP